MKKTLVINGKECMFKSSASIPRIYRMKFGRDIFVDMAKIEKQVKMQERIQKEMREKCEKEGKEYQEDEFESGLPLESLELFENIAYLMHKHGDSSQPSDIDEWLDQFETFDIYEILPEILEMWGIENKQMSTPKKKNGK
jgi:hypothetical protein